MTLFECMGNEKEMMATGKEPRKTMKLNYKVLKKQDETTVDGQSSGDMMRNKCESHKLNKLVHTNTGI